MADPVCHRTINGAYGEPGALTGYLAVNEPRLWHIRRNAHHTPNGALGPHDLGDLVNCHTVLRPHKHGLRSHQRPHQFGHPAGVIRLHPSEYHVKSAPGFRHLKNVSGVKSRVFCSGRGVDGQSVGANGLDVRSPRVKNGDIHAGVDHVGTKRRTDCSCPDKRDSHWLLLMSSPHQRGQSRRQLRALRLAKSDFSKR
ncbi:MAG: Uncharacterised protein [Cellulomonadaceae bacterium TMED98]|nr:MAG: Uncharacterised protein [Cellulomonadaceae bacterium TMED98]